ncbi:MAG TPA: hypothetical protein VGZ25_04965, partial [Gemmataceae bacterium]|nr:hypothetical protein [Gemmataceae bacterium]
PTRFWQRLRRQLDRAVIFMGYGVLDPVLLNNYAKDTFRRPTRPLANFNPRFVIHAYPGHP